LAQSGHPDMLDQCPLGVKRTWGGLVVMSDFDPKPDIGGPGVLQCKLTVEPHFAGRKSLM
jgi:hypothetical protein